MDDNDLQLFQEMVQQLQMHTNEAGESVPLDPDQITAKDIRSALLDTGIMLAGATRAEHLGSDETSAYYYVPVPLTVHPVKGTFFESVQVRLILNPGQSSRPAVFDIFPAQQYRTVMNTEGNVQIGISDVFEFVSVVTGGNVAVQLAKTLIKATSLDDLKVNRKFGYLAREAVIQTSPRYADTAQWVLTGRELFEQEEHLELGLILQVPLTLDNVLIACELSARKRNNSIRTLLLEDVKRLEAMRSIMDKFGEKGINVLQALKNHLQNGYWNVVQEDLPAWKLDDDLVHTYD